MPSRFEGLPNGTRACVYLETRGDELTVWLTPEQERPGAPDDFDAVYSIDPFPAGAGATFTVPVTLGSGARMSRWAYDLSCLPQKQRAAARSKTFPGIAKAMAEQGVAATE